MKASTMTAAALCAVLALVLVPASAFRFTTDPALLSLDLAQTDPELGFSLWKAQYNKVYKDDHDARYQIWKSNLDYIVSSNSEQSSFKLALNAFADLTHEEFVSTYLGTHPEKGGSFREREANSPFMYANVEASSLPATVDWRKEGVVTPVKNQLMCGSCWAFSTTGSVEGINAIKTGKLVSLSEQELVDCDTAKDMGCGGGLMDYAFDYITKNGGLDTEADYPYLSFGLFCQRNKENRTVVTIDGYEDVPENDEVALRKAAAHQPISVAICASQNLQFYASGILTKCCKDLDHGVLVVGYGEEDGTPYWLVKNSWGASWGEEGFFRLEADTGKGGMCGIAKAASYPIKTSPNPPPQPESCGWLGWTTCQAGDICYCSLPFIWDFLCLQYDCQTDPDVQPAPQ